MTVEKSSQDPPPDSSALISREDLELWLRQETADCNKALELRLKEAASIVSAYSSGQLSPQEANERYWQYIHRWGEALPGTHVGGNETDEEIVVLIDLAQGKAPSLAETKLAYEKVINQEKNVRVVAEQNDDARFWRIRAQPKPLLHDTGDFLSDRDDDPDPKS